MTHCEACGVTVGENDRSDFFECPHGDATCEPAGPCAECREMAGQPTRATW